MISVDTSVVVRYIVGTPAEQGARAARLIDGDADLGISVVALAETAHVLRSFYRVPRADIAEHLINLITRTNVTTIEISKTEALDALVRARSYASLPITDALIAASARAFGALPVYTFDELFARLGAAVATP